MDGWRSKKRERWVREREEGEAWATASIGWLPAEVGEDVDRAGSQGRSAVQFGACEVWTDPWVSTDNKRMQADRPSLESHLHHLFALCSSGKHKHP